MSRDRFFELVDRGSKLRDELRAVMAEIRAIDKAEGLHLRNGYRIALRPDVRGEDPLAYDTLQDERTLAEIIGGSDDYVSEDAANAEVTVDDMRVWLIEQGAFRQASDTFIGVSVRVQLRGADSDEEFRGDSLWVAYRAAVRAVAEETTP
jgi:hypothetical protein